MKLVALFALFALACAAPQWAVKDFNYATIAFDIAFTDAKNGISPISINGQGSWVQATTDGGATWTQQPGPAAPMYMGGDAVGNTAVVSGMFGLQYSTMQAPGQYNFSESTEAHGFGFTGQNVEALNSQFYGAAGQTVNNENGVAITTNGGALFTFFNVTELTTEARYASFPSTKVWYIAAGQWPNTQARARRGRQGPVKDLTSRIRIHADGQKAKFEFVKTEAAASPDDLGWKAQIVKTTDGGQTWTSVFSDSTFYFNQIGCGSETHCCATGEADTSSAPGVRVYCTTDGGATWQRTFYNADPELSIMPLNFVSDQEVWAGGGRLNQMNFNGFFLHSLDGGATWTNTTMKGVYINCMSFPSAANGFATAFNVVDNSALLTYA